MKILNANFYYKATQKWMKEEEDRKLNIAEQQQKSNNNRNSSNNNSNWNGSCRKYINSNNYGIGIEVIINAYFYAWKNEIFR